MVILVPYPYCEPLADPELQPYRDGLKRGTITDLKGYYQTLAHLQRRYNETAVTVASLKHPDSIVFMAEFWQISAATQWTLVVPVSHQIDEELMAWNDPYRYAIDLISARAVKDYKRADSYRMKMLDLWGAQTRVGKHHIRITNAE